MNPTQRIWIIPIKAWSQNVAQTGKLDEFNIENLDNTIKVIGHFKKGP